MRGSSIGCTFISFYWNVLAPSLIGITCWMIFMSYVSISSYVHVKTSPYYFKKRMKAYRSFGVQQVPILTYFGSLLVPKLIYSCNRVELWVLALPNPIKRFYRSYNFSNDTTPLGMRFPLLALAASYNSFSWSSSSIATSWTRQSSP